MNGPSPGLAGRAGGAGAAILVVLLAGMLALPMLVLAGAAATAPPPGCGPAGTAQTITGITLDAEQMANAATVVDVTAARGLPPYAATVGLAVVAAESMFHNITVAVDHDSLGLFQQRERYYGRDVATHPAKATGAFLDRLITEPAWQTRPLTEVAADIQRPRHDLRGRYAHWQPLAGQLAATLWPTALTGAAGGGMPCPQPLTQTPPGGAQVPTGLILDGSPAAITAVTFAIAQLGKPYKWGAEGPHSYDCSGLTMAAWNAAGITIPRTTFGQVSVGIPVTLGQARTGDLVFIPGSLGTPAAPRHVGIIAGRTRPGAVWIIHAPRTGDTIRFTTATTWAGDLTTIRRVR